MAINTKPPVLSDNQMLQGMNSTVMSSDVQAQLQELMLEKMLEDRALEQQKKAIKKRQREMTALEQAKKRQEEIGRQDGCPHVKPNGNTALAVMKNHQHHVMGVCQNCFKEFSTIPYHLMPTDEAIGGPN